MSTRRGGRQTFDIRRCEHFETTYLTKEGWDSHTARCPEHGHADEETIARRYHQ